MTALALLAGVAQAAATDGWIAVQVRGTVVRLIGGHWEELARGGALAADEVVRTLHSGRLVLQRSGGTVRLAGETAIRVSGRGSDDVAVRQYSGSLVVEPAPGQTITVETPMLAVVARDGVAQVVFDGNAVSVSVSSGNASVLDRRYGLTAVLGAGQAAASSAAGMVVSGVGTLPAIIDARGNPVASATEAPGRTLPNGGAMNSGNGNGNNGGTGNGQGNGNGNGDNGNSQGNGQGNGKGNGQGNG